MLVKIYVTLKKSVLDPEGATVTKTLHTLGYDEIDEVRIGKYMEVKVNMKDKKAIEERIQEMCEKLLVNTVIETYSYELVEA